MKLKFKKIFDNLNVFLFSIAVFSIPSFSWTENYYLITWVFTITFLFSSLSSLLFFYKIKIDIICISFTLFICSSFLSSLFNGFLTFGASVYLNTILVIFIYIFCASNKEIVPKLFKAAWIGLLIFLLYFMFHEDNVQNVIEVF